jgi:hypothetical protein
MSYLNLNIITLCWIVDSATSGCGDTEWFIPCAECFLSGIKSIAKIGLRQAKYSLLAELAFFPI